ncbi:unnamed protein product [Orchesella dallaii]|uniref:Uncharacterized protein n=1 Tax=Orchesella dallaii TaxID=48710 RepID=A0ABP1PRB7_9HEXA
MAPPHQVTTFFLFLVVSTQNLVNSQQQPYFFNYQPQQQQQYQQDNYQPFSHSPPGTYYQPTYESHTAGGGGDARGPGLLTNFFGDGTPPTQATNPLVTYPTQVTTVGGPQSTSGAANIGQFQHQQPSFQPIGNGIFQQTPTVTTPNNQNNVFRPSSPFGNHHTHIVNGLPKQQFFGNNYAFFRERHGLTNIPSTSGPFHQQNTLSNSDGSHPQQPTPPQLVSTAAAPTASAQTEKVNPIPVQQQPSSRPPTQPSLFAPPFSNTNFFGPNHGPSAFPPVNAGPSHFGPLGGPDGPPPPPQLHLGPVPLGPGGPLPIPPGAPIQGPVFRVGPRGRLLRRKTRPRPQSPDHQLATAGVVSRESPSEAPPSPSPSQAVIRDLPPVPQELNSEGPFPHPLYSPAPFLHPHPAELVTTFRPGPPPNLLVQQSIAVDDEVDRPVARPTPIAVRANNRFRFSPRPTAPTTTTRSRVRQEEDSQEASNQYDSEEEAPPPPQRKRPQFSTTTTTTETPSPSRALGDRANILQRQIRFKNRQKNTQKNERS